MLLGDNTDIGGGRVAADRVAVCWECGIELVCLM